MGYDIVTDPFFRLSTKSDLSKFCSEIDPTDAFSVALRHRALRWLERYPDTSDDFFHPGQFLSGDLSTVMYGLCPTIFLGSNNWALKRDLPEQELVEKVGYFSHRVRYLTANNPNKFCFVLVPEKDIVIDFLGGRRHILRSINNAMAVVADTCNQEGQSFVYDGFLSKLPAWISEDEYEYADSHLLSRDYLLIFQEIIQKLGFNHVDTIGEYNFYLAVYYGDLNDKFINPLFSRQRFLQPDFKSGKAELIGGSKTFETPLGKTFQIFHNESAKINLKVAIYGDSHSSVIFNKKFTYMFASVFKHCEFHWVPWGGVPEKFKSDADIVIMEMAQRFVFT